MPRRGRYRRARAARAATAAAALPEIAAIDLRASRPERGRWLAPAAGRGDARRRSRAGEQALLFLNRRGYAPLTLCRACGHRFQCPQLLGLAGRAPLPRPPASATIAASRSRGPPACPDCGAADESLVACRPRRRAPRRGGRRRCFPRRGCRSCRQRHRRRRRAAARRDLAAIEARRGRHRHRHPARRQGPQLPAPDAGRRGRRRSRPGRRRPARGRAHLPAAAPGDRPRRARRRARPGAAADLCSRSTR